MEHILPPNLRYPDTKESSDIPIHQISFQFHKTTPFFFAIFVSYRIYSKQILMGKKQQLSYL